MIATIAIDSAACPVHIGPELLEGVRDFIDAELPDVDRILLIADGRVLEHHGARLRGFVGVPVHVLPSGEVAKSLRQLELALAACADEGLSRSSVIVSLGGGATSDLAGLTASLFKRGLRVVHIATSLLAQVDASIGGKTAINLPAGKNLAGTFHTPTAIFADTSILRTVSPLDWRAGLGEVVKTALIAGEAQLAFVEQNVDAILERDLDVVADLVRRCVEAKGAVVTEDPFEEGPRRVLNLGHTFAHAIEFAAGYTGIAHGVAVACGIGLALEAAQEIDLLEDADLPKRVNRLFGRLGLPRTILELRSPMRPLAPSVLMRAFEHDKKGRFGEPRFVLPKAVGRFDLSVKLDGELLEHLLR